MDGFKQALTVADSLVWGPWFLIPLLLGTGLVLTIRLRGIQFRTLPSALRHAFVDKEADSADGDISNYQALTTALAATVGVGNIVGVATAISVGGPGSLFWMWITGLVGMASKYAEAFLGVRFRITDAKGEQSGGPHQYLERGITERFGKPKLGRFLALWFTIFAALASFGIGNLTQANAISSGLEHAFGFDKYLVGGLIFIAVGTVLLGGIQTIGKTTAAFVPLMIVIYLVGGTWVLVTKATEIIPALELVFTSAFSGHAAAGGFLGSTFLLTLQMGVARGIFSNESGMGSAAIAAAAAKTTHPVRQGLVSMTQTFIDTIIVVTFTGLVLITSGQWTAGKSEAGSMTSNAFGSAMEARFGAVIVSISIVFFAFSTILGWAYYGERCITRLLGMHASLPYRLLFTVITFVGATTALETVWTLADLLNGLMAVPNLIGLLLLSGLVARETKAYLAFDRKLKASPEAVAAHLEAEGTPWR